ncbi:hypothetical protein ACMFMG_010700 [Clarireedia jacksonii]
MASPSTSTTGENSSTDWTVLSPTGLLENFTPNNFGKVLTTAWEMGLKDNKSLQMIATSDLGSFATKAFMNPDEARGQAVSLGRDDFTYEEMERIFKEKTGKEIPSTWKLPAKFMMVAVKELGAVYNWFGQEGSGTDAQASKKEELESKDFGTRLDTFETKK